MSKNKQAAKEKPIATLIIRGGDKMLKPERKKVYDWMIKEAEAFLNYGRCYAPTMTSKFWR